MVDHGRYQGLQWVCLHLSFRELPHIGCKEGAWGEEKNTISGNIRGKLKEIWNLKEHGGHFAAGRSSSPSLTILEGPTPVLPQSPESMILFFRNSNFMGKCILCRPYISSEQENQWNLNDVIQVYVPLSGSLKGSSGNQVILMMPLIHVCMFLATPIGRIPHVILYITLLTFTCGLFQRW